jgi:hypothetical protein
MENNFNVFTFGLLSSFHFGWEILRERYGMGMKWNIISYFIGEQKKIAEGDMRRETKKIRQ